MIRTSINSGEKRLSRLSIDFFYKVLLTPKNSKIKRKKLNKIIMYLVNYLLTDRNIISSIDQSFREEILETLLFRLDLYFFSGFGTYIFSSCLSFSFCMVFLKITDLKSLMSLEDRFMELFMSAFDL
jgi:hypothetical protein